jgi:hypothetical protein
MKEYFICHSIVSDDPYNSKCVGWCIVGNGWFVKAGFLSIAKEVILKRYPEATFEEGMSVYWGEEDKLISK